MSDTTDEMGFLGRQVLRKSQVNPLRDRMREFLSGHEPAADLKELRREAAGGRNMSEVVNEGREERL